MDKLDALESQSVYILREAYREFKSLVMLWSIGKDSTVLLWLARKAFFGQVPFPVDVHTEPYTGVIVGARTGEGPSRSKERYFSPRDTNSKWDVGDQPPELWDQFNTDFAPGTHIRIHPLLDWTELNIWEYIQREGVPVTDLYFDQGKGKRYRSLGCYPCTAPVDSTAQNAADVVKELHEGKFKNVAERSGRAQDKEDRGGLETLRQEGYM